MFRSWEEAPCDPRQNLSVYFRLREYVRPDMAVRALESLLNQQPELRRAYRRQAGVLRRGQPVFEHHNIAVVDARSWTEEELERKVWQQIQTPFDLPSGQIFRARIYSLARREQRLLICVHAVAADAECLPIMVAEFSRIYNGLERKNFGSRSAATIETAAEVPAPASTEDSLAFWAEHLSGATPELTLPFDRRRKPDTRTFSRGKRELFLSQDVQERIENLSRSIDVPLSSVYLAGYSVVLSRYAAASEVRVGCSATMRNGKCRDSSIANLSNTITITADCNATLSIEQMLKKIDSIAAHAFQHRQVPFPLVLRHVTSKRGEFAERAFFSLFLLAEPSQACSRL